ncbi:MAG: hypothetical protein KF819_34805 [Labilithrix sp.]|nr:hypothetical protein [Labilithrix sp.]
MRQLAVVLIGAMVGLGCDDANANARVESSVEVSVETSEEVDAPPRVPVLTIDGGFVERASMKVRGKVEDASEPPIFRLRGESGCARDVKLATTSTGIAFSIALGVDELTDAFGCAIDGDVGDRMLPPIEIAPAAETISSSAGLSLDPSVALVSADVDPRAGQVVRLVVDADDAVREARATLGGRTYLARLAPASEDETSEASVILEIPARAWAEAVVSGASVDVDVTDPSGKHRALRVRPSARVEKLVDEGD